MGSCYSIYWVSYPKPWNHGFLLLHKQGFIFLTLEPWVSDTGFIFLTLEPWVPATPYTGFYILNPGTMGSCYSIYKVSYSKPWNHGFLLLYIQGFIFLTLEPWVSATPYTGFHILHPRTMSFRYWFHILHPRTMSSCYSMYTLIKGYQQRMIL